MKPCRHGRILYGVNCINCEKREAATNKIKMQPFYEWKPRGFGGFNVIANRTASWAAKEMLRHCKPFKLFGGAKDRITRQPFFKTAAERKAVNSVHHYENNEII